MSGKAKRDSQQKPVIPDKLYFKIGEVSQIAQVEPYVLRYWESEFNMMKPARTKAKQRLYHRKDVELILEIKRLLYEEKFTISGAKKKLMERKSSPSSGQLKGGAGSDLYKLVEEVKKALNEIRALLMK